MVTTPNVADCPTPGAENPQNSASVPSWDDLHAYVDIYMREGASCLLVQPMSKNPLAGWGPHTYSDDPDFLHEAIKAEKAAGHQPPNLGIEATGSFIVADIDTPDEVAEFTTFLGEAPAYSVKTPGKFEDGEWKHSEGGHIYYQIDPADTELAEARTRLGSKVLVPGAALYIGAGAYVIAPPSTRAEGAYKYVGNAVPLPQRLRDFLIQKAAKKNPTAGPKQAHVPGTDCADSFAWDEILEGTGMWTRTGNTDNCGCPIWHFDGATNERSAVAHEGDCSHAPFLHIYSDTARKFYGVKDNDNLQKLQVYAHHHTGGSIRQARLELGIPDELPASVLQGSAPAAAATIVSEPIVEETTEEIFTRRLAEGIAEIEASLGRDLTPQQRDFFEQGVWATADRTTETPDWEKLPGPERQRLHGVDMPPMTAKECAEIFNLNDHTRAVWWYMADGFRMGNPLAVLLRQLQRVARRVPVTVSASPYGHQPMSTYISLVGDSGGGKTAVDNVDLWPVVGNCHGVTMRKMDEDRRENTGTVAALYEAYHETVDGPDGKGKVTQVRTPAVLDMYLDELAQDLGVGKEAKGHAGGMFEALSSAWSSKDFSRSSAEHRRSMPEHYTLTIFGNLTPSKAGALLETSDQGFMQRWFFVPSDCPYTFILDDSEIARPQGDGTPNIRPSSPGIGAFEWCPKMHQEYRLAVYRTQRRKRTERMIKQAHSFPTRFRLACAMAAMEGSFTVRPEVWDWACLVYEVSSRTLSWVEHEVQEKRHEQSRERGRDRGIANRAARVGEQEAITADAQKILEVVTERGAEGATWTDLKGRFSRNRHSEVKNLLGELVKAGQLRVETRLNGNGRTVNLYRLPM